ncbi:MAG: hypothetical protein AAFY72_02750 [Cyanobacteria bacterium J06649_4]
MPKPNDSPEIGPEMGPEMGPNEIGPNVEPEIAPETVQELEALRQDMMRTWWKICLGIWLTVGIGCLWWIRRDLVEISEYFTWAAVRSIFLYQRPAGTGLAFCIALTFVLLLSESRQILWGISKDERKRLLINLQRIHAQGPSHPQWKVIRPDESLKGKSLTEN